MVPRVVELIRIIEVLYARESGVFEYIQYSVLSMDTGSYLCYQGFLTHMSIARAKFEFTYSASV